MDIFLLLTELLSKSLNPQCCACGEAVLLIFSLQRGGGAFSLHRNVYTGTSPVKRSHRLTFLRNLEKKSVYQKESNLGMPDTPFFCHSLYILASGNTTFLWEQEHLLFQKEEKDQHGI